MKIRFDQLVRIFSRPALLFWIAAAVLFSPLLFKGQALFWGTPSTQFVPWWDFAFSSLLEGELPLWNRWVGMGAPLIANYQSALFYPPYWVLLMIYAFFGVTGMAWSITLVVIFHLSWAGIGTARLLKEMGTGKLGQMVGGLAFSLSGYLVARSGFLSINAAASWLPWMLLYSYQVCTARKDSIIKLGIIISMQLLAGHAQTAWYSLLMVGFWSVFWIWKSSKPNHSWLDMLSAGAKLAVSGLIALGLSAVQLVPTVEYLAQSQRAGEYGYAQAMTYSFWPWRFLTLMVPNLFGSPAQGSYWGYGNYWEDAVYIGLLPLLFGLTFLVRAYKKGSPYLDGKSRDQSALARFLFGMIAASFVLALGDRTPVFPFLYRYIPTFDLFQAPTRFSLIAVMAMAILAGISAESITKPQGKSRYWSNLAAAGSFAVALGSLLGFLFLENVKTTFFVPIGMAGAMALAGILLIHFKPAPAEELKSKIWDGALAGLIALDLIIAGWGLNPGTNLDFYHPGKASGSAGRVWISPDLEHDLKFKDFFLFDTFDSNSPLEEMYAYPIPNTGIVIRQETVNNFDPIIPGRFQEWMIFTEGLKSDPEHQAFQLMGAEQVISSLGAQINGKLDPSFAQNGFLAVADFKGFSGDQTILEKIRKWGPEESFPLLVEGLSKEPVDCAGRGNGKITLLERAQGSISAKVVLEKSSWIFWSQTWMPGWNFTLDGKSAGPVARANYIFMAACVPSGEHVIEFNYQPASIRIGAFISLASLSMILGIYLLRRKGEE